MAHPRARHRIAKAPIAITASVSAVAFAVVSELVAKRKTNSFDGKVRARIGTRHPRNYRKTVETLGYSGKPWVHGPLAALLASYIERRGSLDGARAINLANTLATTVSKSCDWLLKHRQPPPGRHSPQEQSFPSGHTLETASVALTAAHVLWREGKADPRVVFPIAAMIPMLEGAGRLYLDRHWATDVIGGLLAGIAVASVCVLGYEERAYGR